MDSRMSDAILGVVTLAAAVVAVAFLFLAMAGNDAGTHTEVSCLQGTCATP